MTNVAHSEKKTGTVLGAGPISLALRYTTFTTTGEKNTMSEHNDVAESTVAQDSIEQPRASYWILDSLRDKISREASKDLNSRLDDALEHFPSLQGETITVGWLHPESEDSINGRAHSHNRMFNIPADQYTTNITLYHELGHLAIWELRQQGEEHPKTSEEYCSIFSMAKMPPKAVDEQRIPYLGKSPLDTERFPEICERALDYREEHRNYIQKCKEWLQVDS